MIAVLNVSLSGVAMELPAEDELLSSQQVARWHAVLDRAETTIIEKEKTCASLAEKLRSAEAELLDEAREVDALASRVDALTSRLVRRCKLASA